MTEGRTGRHFDRDPHGLADRSTLLAGVERGTHLALDTARAADVVHATDRDQALDARADRAGSQRGFLQSGLGSVGGRVGHGPHRWVQAAPHIRP